LKDKRVRWVIAACAVLAAVLRGYLLSRPGHLLGVTEADDGILFGNALRLAGGVIPYRDFAVVQPPGSILLMFPVALVAKVVGSAWGLAIARVLTVAADTACVVLIGLLVRHRGALTTGLACGIYAVYPDSLIASHTFLLEPWLNLFCLAGAACVFDRDSFASGRRLMWGGVAFGFAAAIKIWALVPLAIVCVLLLPRARRLGALAVGALAGFGVPLLPFLILAPGAVVRGVFTGQFVRSSGGHSGLLYRLGDLAGLAVFPPVAGRLMLVVVAGVTASFFAAPPRARLDWFALTGAVAVAAMFLLPRLYYSHYGALEGLFLALAIALPVGRLVAYLAGHGLDLAAPLVAAVAAAALIAGVGVRDLVGEPRIQPGPSVSAAKALIPAGSCVLTDAPSYTMAANRFISTDPGCPALVDPQGTLIEMTDGRGVYAAPAVTSKVSELWLNGFTAARYVWLFPGSGTRIPWTPALNAYLVAHFRLIAFGSTGKSGGDVPRSGLYVRRLTPVLPQSRREPTWGCTRYARYIPRRDALRPADTCRRPSDTCRRPIHTSDCDGEQARRCTAPQ
jgi:alpha-1,2-mannosyltransferase